MNVLVEAVAGSHLFGTNTPASDRDFKGVYLPSKQDILLGTAKASVNRKTNTSGQKNTKDDVDVEFYSLQKFMQMLDQGQTVALELLWTPDELLVSTSPFWKELQEHRAELLHKKVTAFVGYCKTQADKYGVKGSRMAAAKNVLHFLKSCDVHPNTRLSTYWDDLIYKYEGIEHVEFGVQETTQGPIRFMEVCNRKYQEHISFQYAKESLEKLYDAYGARAKQAEENEGIDWKALSHAYRVCCQALEILNDHKLSLPMKPEDLEVVRQVKLGKVPFNVFQPMLEEKLEQVLHAQASSTLPESFDYDKWCVDFVMKVYQDVVNKE